MVGKEDRGSSTVSKGHIPGTGVGVEELLQLPLAEIGLVVAVVALTAVVFLLARGAKRETTHKRTPPARQPLEPQPTTSPLRRLEQDLAGLADFIHEFPELMTDIYSQTEVRQIPAVLLRALIRTFRAEQAVVLVRRKGTLIEPERSSRLIVAAVSSSERGLEVGAEIPIGMGQLGIVAQTQRVMDRNDFGSVTDSNLLAYQGARLPLFEVAAPMVHGTDTLGVLAFSRPQRHHPHEKEMMHMIAQLGALAWHNLTAYRHVKVAADVDELTGIFNKRALKFRLSELVYEARQNSGRASVFLFDIDHFKNYNDVNGHIAGDQALRLLAQLVRDTVRADDIFGRFGGEEFLSPS